MRAEEENAKDALAVTLSYFSGPYTKAELRQLYNPRGPYSVADPHPPAPARYVNVQSGATREAWGMDGPRWQGDRIVTVIENPTKVAEWLLTGTRKMIPRPYVPAIEAGILPRVEKRRAEAWERIVRRLQNL
jgi:hypothetical protein